MGAAAQQRGDAVIRRQIHGDLDEKRLIENEVKAVQIALECDQFVRQAMDYLVESRGLRKATVERAKSRRGWNKRNLKLVSAHNDWVNADTRYAYTYHASSVNRAKAAYELLIFALGCWTVPDNIKVPRAAKC